MLVTRRSAFSGFVRTMELNITVEQVAAYTRGGILIQDAFPQLSASEREFYMTGVTQEEWDDMFKEDES
jgi:hypothetical protein